MCFVIGAVALIGAFAVGEVTDLGSGHGDGLPFLSLTTLATALFGFGAAGAVATIAHLSTPIALTAALALGISLVATTRGLILPYLLKQQDNSHISRTSYVGLLGTVTLTIMPERCGEVSFADTEGNRVHATAISLHRAPLTTGTIVYIADVDDQYLRVVTVDDAI
ncbi:hypothetical protein [Rhodococcus sp. IEGM 1379]|uniref:hypothetical protein n=1 Tax=Rhodococcus sp. IEGM 1379 TaxID=3047086 RepID=UPI0024B64C33|nr:hypothetical protein [Rhodococcus sp. IEGM 1379]MDI9918266.1 hypothetical protein [Rhodococcus sp. IEGM 1379]